MTTEVIFNELTAQQREDFKFFFKEDNATSSNSGSLILEEGLTGSFNIDLSFDSFPSLNAQLYVQGNERLQRIINILDDRPTSNQITEGILDTSGLKFYKQYFKAREYNVNTDVLGSNPLNYSIINVAFEHSLLDPLEDEYFLLEVNDVNDFDEYGRINLYVQNIPYAIVAPFNLYRKIPNSTSRDILTTPRAEIEFMIANLGWVFDWSDLSKIQLRVWGDPPKKQPDYEGTDESNTSNLKASEIVESQNLSHNNNEIDILPTLIYTGTGSLDITSSSTETAIVTNSNYRDYLKIKNTNNPFSFAGDDFFTPTETCETSSKGITQDDGLNDINLFQVKYNTAEEIDYVSGDVEPETSSYTGNFQRLSDNFDEGGITKERITRTILNGVLIREKRETFGIRGLKAELIANASYSSLWGKVREEITTYDFDEEDYPIGTTTTGFTYTRIERMEQQRALDGTFDYYSFTSPVENYLESGLTEGVYNQIVFDWFRQPVRNKDVATLVLLEDFYEDYKDIKADANYRKPKFVQLREVTKDDFIDKKAGNFTFSAGSIDVYTERVEIFTADRYNLNRPEFFIMYRSQQTYSSVNGVRDQRNVSKTFEEIEGRPPQVSPFQNQDPHTLEPTVNVGVIVYTKNKSFILENKNYKSFASDEVDVWSVDIALEAFLAKKSREFMGQKKVVSLRTIYKPGIIPGVKLAYRFNDEANSRLLAATVSSSSVQGNLNYPSFDGDGNLVSEQEGIDQFDYLGTVLSVSHEIDILGSNRFSGFTNITLSLFSFCDFKERIAIRKVAYR